MTAPAAEPRHDHSRATDSFLATLVSRARTLHEVIDGGIAEPATAPRPPITEPARRRLHEWRELSTCGDDGLFAKHLAWDGLDLGAVATALRDDELLPPEGGSHAPLPAWARLFATAYGTTRGTLAAALTQARAERADGALRAEEPLPFETFYLPLLRVARAMVGARLPDVADLASDEAMSSLERSLLRRLTMIGAGALQLQCNVYRMVTPVAADADAAADFLRLMHEGALLDFFAEHAVAARLCATVSLLWAEATAELLGRAARDRVALATTFNEGLPLGRIRALRTDLSDPHLGGRAVAILEWEAGVTVVYKPRPVTLDAEFAVLQHFVNALVPALELRPLRVSDHGSYGWIEYARQADCAPDGVPRYFSRCGALLCLAYVMNGTDFHYENLLAAGEHPVLLDLEMLMGPRFEMVEQLDTIDCVATSAQRAVLDSVINARMLPTVKCEGSGPVTETGALGGPVLEARFIRGGHWPAQGAAVYGKHNLPRVNGTPVEGFAHAERVAGGFADVYRALMDHADELIAPGAVLDRCGRLPIRFILRNTSLYTTLLQRCLHPRFLRTGIDRSVQLEVLKRTFLRLDERPAIWPAVREEIAALEQMDVPMFLVSAESTTLPLRDGVVLRGCFEASAMEEMRARLEALSERDLRRQTDLIAATFAATRARDLRVEIRDVAPAAPAAPGTPHRAFDAETAIVEAAAIADRIAANRVGRRDSAGWIGTRYSATGRRHVVGAMTHALLDGYGGLAVFLASLAKVSGNALVADHAREALLPLRSRIGAVDRMLSLRRVLHPGAGTGVGSAIYVLASVGRCLGDRAMIDEARLVARSVARLADRVATDDVVSGAAGGILALLALHRAGGGDEPLAAASLLARGLMARRVVGEIGLRAWCNGQPTIEAGMAHGQAGIAYALVALSACTGDEGLAAAAGEAIAHERQMLRPGLAGGIAMESTAAWSRGTTGITLARLGGWNTAGDADVAEVAVGLQESEGAMHSGADTLCCGTAARIELLGHAGRMFGREALTEAAHAGAWQLMGTARRSGYDLGWSPTRTCQAGLFLGEAGIGLTLLRLAHPGDLPSPALII